jgi:hypothetical protein
VDHAASRSPACRGGLAARPTHEVFPERKDHNTFVSRLDREQREEFEETYQALAVITECNDFLVNTAWAYREGEADWIAEAERIRAGHGTA